MVEYIKKLHILRRLKNSKKIEDYHVEAGVKFEKLINSGWPSSYLVREKVDTFPAGKYHPNLAGLQLAKLDKGHTQILLWVLIYDVSLQGVGRRKGALKKTTAYRTGLKLLQDALEHASLALG